MCRNLNFYRKKLHLNLKRGLKLIKRILGIKKYVRFFKQLKKSLIPWDKSDFLKFVSIH